MCSINGFNYKDFNAIQKMVDITAHRGPDGRGHEALPTCSLGHARLAVIDLSDGGSQPMWNNDRNICIVYNGEIYNYKELREELKDRYKFISESDTEVLLALYEIYGLEGLNKLNGIFAFGLWDGRKDEIVIARDPVGVKPLYYFWDGKKFVFASEIKAILSVIGNPSINHNAINFYLLLTYVPGPDTMFNDIKKLDPGTFAIFKNNDLKFGKYWKGAKSKPISRNEATEKIRMTAEKAVNSQLISDRPLGIMLSGGLDSTVIAVMASKQLQGELRTYTSRFDIKERSEKYNKDADAATKLAQKLGAKHTEVIVGAKELVGDLDDIMWHLEEPLSNPNLSACYRISKEASKDVAVLLGGDGVDELFGGYPSYTKSQWVSLMRKLPFGLRKLAAGASSGFIRERLVDKILIQNDHEHYLTFWAVDESNYDFVHGSPGGKMEPIRDYFRSKYFFEQNEKNFESRMMEVDLNSWFANESLLRSDKLISAWGVEGRVPFLDMRMLDLSASIPASWKINPLWSSAKNFKRIWADSFRGVIPDELFDQPKSGWIAPLALWLLSPEVIKDVKERIGAMPSELVDKDFLMKLYDKQIEKGGGHYLQIWSMVVLDAWRRKFNVSL